MRTLIALLVFSLSVHTLGFAQEVLDYTIYGLKSEYTVHEPVILTIRAVIKRPEPKMRQADRPYTMIKVNCTDVQTKGITYQKYNGNGSYYAPTSHEVIDMSQRDKNYNLLLYPVEHWFRKNVDTVYYTVYLLVKGSNQYLYNNRELIRPMLLPCNTTLSIHFTNQVVKKELKINDNPEADDLFVESNRKLLEIKDFNSFCAQLKALQATNTMSSSMVLCLVAMSLEKRVKALHRSDQYDFVVKQLFTV